MEAILLYFGKVILCSGVMFLYYQLSLKDKTFHHYNRFYLLSAMLISLLLPLIKVDDFTIEVNNDVYALIDRIQNFNTTKNINNDHIYFRIIFSALGLVSLCFLGKLIYGILKIQKLKSQFRKESFDGINFYRTDLTEAPFSYFRNLFWKNSIMLNSDIGEQILKHEMVHIEQKHSFDKIFIEVITSVFWFNPFFHIIKKEISLIHEYLADKKAVKQSDTKAFAQMLLASHFSGTQLPATSPFLSSNLKKRLKMLQKPKTKFGYARRIFALPVLFSVAFAYMVDAKNKEIKETNMEIEKAVSQIKQDTISPGNKTIDIVKKQQEKLSKASEKLKTESEKLKTLSEQSKQKAEELKKIAKEKGEDSYDFELKAKELKQLSGEMDKLTHNYKEFQIDFNEIEKIKDKAMSDFPDMKFPKMEINKMIPGNISVLKINGNDIDLNNIFDSKEFKDLGLSDEKMKVLKERFNSPEFREKVNKINKLYYNGKEVFPDSEEGKKILKEYSAKDYSFYNKNSNKKLSRKEIRKLEKLSKEKAEIEKRLNEIRKEQKDVQGNNPWIINVDAHATAEPKNNYTDNINKQKVIKYDSKNNMMKSDFDENIKVYINGKEVTQKEMVALAPVKIGKISISKNTTDGKTTSEMRIETKK